MGLVDYSDSDASETEETLVVKPTPSTSKSNFQKVVDRSNPGKIRVTLPETALQVEDRSDEPPTKRVKTGGGALSGFNSFLPAPKRSGNSTNMTLGGGVAATKGGLGSGISLKTGAAPAFDRGRELGKDYSEGVDGEDDAGSTPFGGSGLSLPPPKASPVDGQKPPEDVRLVGKPLLFKPLSVARKPAKKKKQEISAASTPLPSPHVAAASAHEPNTAEPHARPKVSLFSISTEELTLPQQASAGEYKPMIYEPASNARTDREGRDDDLEPSYEEYTPTTSHFAPPFAPTPPVSESLDDIAGDLNLSAAERRQLFGRQNRGKKGAVPVAKKIINFNTDKEYLHNEELRAAGEQPVHNPVRALAPGKHSLKQLVNAVQSQKDALEESFAKGKNNRAEANSRYGFGR